MSRIRAVVVTAALMATPALASDPPPLPAPAANQAVAGLGSGEGFRLLSALGLGPGKEWRDTLRTAATWASGDAAWRSLPDLPVSEGRLAAAAVGMAGAFWVFGGYTVAEDGGEVSTPEVFRWRPGETGWTRVTQMPVPVDDMVVVVLEDRWIYLVSGWHDVGNVNLVQIYDVELDHWSQAEPWPGTPVFGHAGGLVGRTLVICGGVGIRYPPGGGARQFEMVDECWRGDIRPDDPRRIDWRAIDTHPGAPRYRSAAGTDGRAVYFVGGATNPYNYDGIGYNGEPSAPVAAVVSFEPVSNGWRCHDDAPTATMDHRGLPWDGERFYVVGGMRAGQQVSDAVMVLAPGPAQRCADAGASAR